MSPVERAARALARHESGTDCYDGLDEAQQQTLQESVRVVLEALQEPADLEDLAVSFDPTASWSPWSPWYFTKKQSARRATAMARAYAALSE